MGYFLLKIDESGTEEWTKTFGGSNYDLGSSVYQLPSDEYIITGSSMSFGAGGFDIYLIKADSEGNEIWSTVYGGDSQEYGKNGWLTSDLNYIIAGSTQSYGAGQDDFWLIKTGFDVTSTNPRFNQLSKVNISPNPAEDYINIHSDSNINEVKIYNQLSIEISNMLTDHKSIIINTTDFKPGIYFVEIATDNNRIIKRIIVL